MLIVEPVGGLANRMRVIDSAVAVSRQLERPLVIVWKRNVDLNCSFNALFRWNSQMGHICERWESKSLRKLVINPTRMILTGIGHANSFWLGQKQIESAVGAGTLHDLIDANQRVYIQTWSRFWNDRKSGWFESIQFSDSVEHTVNEYVSGFELTLGVHIRRGDNRKARKNSPLSLFVDAMHQELSLRTNTDFFLATDDRKVEMILREEFPGRIRSQVKKSLNRRRPRAIHDALVDLVCLANCRKIYGSYWSSFSDVAAEIKQVQKVILSTSA